ncbi:MAG: hypothetical protein KDB14_30470 [Planctomycetales bacterium]|nr:hypothetical protein [Planctomycetales bacterium]
MTTVTLLAHLYIGLETSYASTLIGVASACTVQLLLDAMLGLSGVQPGYRQTGLIDFLLPPYIVGLTCSIFLFANGRPWPIIFATTVAISSKFLLRVRHGSRTMHFFNPSNLGIIVTLVAFPSVGMIMPFSFSAGFGDVGDFAFPLVLLTLGTIMNGVFTKRLILIFSWLLAFVGQAYVRHLFFDAQLLPILAVATGPIAIMFTFFMISDPGTTPNGLGGQIAFGSSIGLLYGAFMVWHVVYGIFWALMLTCALRGVWLFLTRPANDQQPASIDIRATGELASP